MDPCVHASMRVSRAGLGNYEAWDGAKKMRLSIYKYIYIYIEKLLYI
jgi:hypothetical protein